MRVPGVEIVQVLLHDDVAAAGEVGIFLTDQHGCRCGRAGGILGAVDEAQQVAFVEVFEAMHLVDDLGVRSEPRGQLARELKAQIHPPGPDVEEQIAGRGHRAVPRTGELGKRMQRSWARVAEEPVPEIGTDADHARELAVGDAKADRPAQPGDVRQEIAGYLITLRIHRQHKEDRRLGERGEDRLRLCRGGGRRCRRHHSGCLPLLLALQWLMFMLSER